MADITDEVWLQSLDMFSSALTAATPYFVEFQNVIPMFAQTLASFGQSMAEIKQITQQPKPKSYSTPSSSGVKDDSQKVRQIQSVVAPVSPKAADKIGKGLEIMNLVKTLAPLFLAGGGPVAGPGTGTSDSIPAMLSNKEFVVKADVAQQPGMSEFLNNLNSGFAKGGQVNERFAKGGQVRHLAGGGPAVPRMASGGTLGFPGGIGSGIGGGISSVANFLNPITGIIADHLLGLAGSAYNAGEAVASFGHTLRSNVKGVIESREHLAQVAPGIAAVMARKELSELIVDMEKGRRLAPSTDFANRQYMDLNRALIPLETLVGRIENYVSGGLAAAATAVLERLNKLLGASNQNADEIQWSNVLDNIAFAAKLQEARKNAGANRLNAERAALDQFRAKIEIQKFHSKMSQP